MAESSASAWPQNQEQISSTMPGSAWPEEYLEPLALPWPEDQQQQLPAPWPQDQEWRTQDLHDQTQDLHDHTQEQLPLQDQEQLQDPQEQEQLPLASSQDQEGMRRCLGVPGIRFVPSDIELIVYFLQPKLRGEPLPSYMHVCDVYSDHPKELTSKLGPSREGNWYMFSPRIRKYNKGKRPRRSTRELGSWKSTSKNEEVLGAMGEDGTREVIGYKASLTYHEYDENMLTPKLKKEKAIKTPWKMWEYVCYNSNRPFDAEEEPMRLNDWVLCKVTYRDKNATTKKFKSPIKKPKLQREEQPPTQSIAIKRPLESGSASASSSQAKEEEQQETPGSSLPGAGGDDATTAATMVAAAMDPISNYYRTRVTTYGIDMDNNMELTSDGFADGRYL